MVYAYEFEMAPTTVTMAIVRCKEDLNLQTGRRTVTPMVLIGWRQDSSEAYPGAPCLPGGFVDVPEPTKVAATRETKEETHLDIDPSAWRLFYIDDRPGSDPRYSQVINVCYCAYVNEEQSTQAMAGDDLKKLEWVPYEQAQQMELAFNHNEVIDELYAQIIKIAQSIG